MRTKSQVNRVCEILHLDRRQRSILHAARNHIDTQAELTRYGLAVSVMSEERQMEVLRGISRIDTAHTLHLGIVKPYPDFVSQYRVTTADFRNVQGRS